VLETPDFSRKCITAGLRVRRLHPWAFRQLQGFVTYQAAEFGIAMALADWACTSKFCSLRGQTGSPMNRRFVGCVAGRESDVNATLNHARLGEGARAPRADANRPNVGETGNHVGL
jgi:transposase